MRSLIFLFIFVGIKVSAQEIVVVDSITGLPIEGASISSSKETFGETSSLEGKLNISKFKDQDTLIIQHLAYQKKRKVKSSIKNKKVSLTLAPHPLDEVEVFEPKTIDFKTFKENYLNLNFQFTQEKKIAYKEQNCYIDILKKNKHINIVA